MKVGSSGLRLLLMRSQILEGKPVWSEVTGGSLRSKSRELQSTVNGMTQELKDTENLGSFCVGPNSPVSSWGMWWSHCIGQHREHALHGTAAGSTKDACIQAPSLSCTRAPGTLWQQHRQSPEYDPELSRRMNTKDIFFSVSIVHFRRTPWIKR